MHPSRLRRLIFTGLAILLFAGTAFALPVPSKTAPDQTLAEREQDLAAVASVLDQAEVMAVLSSHGFTREEANLRLAQLSPQELGALASQLDQLQAAGQQVPYWIWILIGVLIIVAIVSIA